MEIRPLTFREACRFVAQHHRHNEPPRGHKFSIGLYEGEALVAVAMCGRPVARHFDDGLTIEVNRTCTDGTKNANSMLYGASCRAALAMGYRRVITYTQADETGISLRAAGFRRIKDLPARGDWAASSVKHRAVRDDGSIDLFNGAYVGNGGVSRVLWQRP